MIDLSEPIEVRAPLRWSTRRIAVRVVDPQAFILAVAHRRTALDED